MRSTRCVRNTVFDQFCTKIEQRKTKRRSPTRIQFRRTDHDKVRIFHWLGVFAEEPCADRGRPRHTLDRLTTAEVLSQHTNQCMKLRTKVQSNVRGTPHLPPAASKCPTTAVVPSLRAMEFRSPAQKNAASAGDGHKNHLKGDGQTQGSYTEDCGVGTNTT